MPTLNYGGQMDRAIVVYLSKRSDSMSVNAMASCSNTWKHALHADPWRRVPRRDWPKVDPPVQSQAKTTSPASEPPCQRIE